MHTHGLSNRAHDAVGLTSGHPPALIRTREVLIDGPRRPLAPARLAQHEHRLRIVEPSVGHRERRQLAAPAKLAGQQLLDALAKGFDLRHQQTGLQVGEQFVTEQKGKAFVGVEP